MSKFQSLLNVVHDKQSEKPKRRSAQRKDVAQQELSTIAVRRRGRPTGKRSDPDYEQTTAYIRKQTHRDVKIALLQEGQGREYSELVEYLLAGWLKART